MRQGPAFGVLLFALLLGTTLRAGAHESSEYLQGLQDSLVEYAASDFAAGRSRPDDFRNVDLRYRENDHGARSYMLCGQASMRNGATEAWVDFATIKTLPYEQWLGGSATDMCARAITVPTDANALAAALRTRLIDTQGAGKPD